MFNVLQYNRPVSIYYQLYIYECLHVYFPYLEENS